MPKNVENGDPNIYIMWVNNMTLVVLGLYVNDLVVIPFDLPFLNYKDGQIRNNICNNKKNDVVSY